MTTGKLTPTTILMLVLPPLLWAGNAVIGRMISGMVPPMLLNFLRWSIAFLILLPLGWGIFRKGSGLLARWRNLLPLGLLGIGLYNSLLYLSLQTSTPINVTLVVASMPVWMIIIGRIFFGVPVSPRQIGGAVLSILGVITVLARGDWHQILSLRPVAGDLFMLVAIIGWSFYSWLLIRGKYPEKLHADWASFLLAQVTYGLVWSGLFAAGEWVAIGRTVQWSWMLGAALMYVAIGPAVISYRCWGTAVERAGPDMAGFFNNLTPLFAALLSAAFLGESPQLFHAAAFVLIVSGIIVSLRR